MPLGPDVVLEVCLRHGSTPADAIDRAAAVHGSAGADADPEASMPVVITSRGGLTGATGLATHRRGDTADDTVDLAEDVYENRRERRRPEATSLRELQRTYPGRHAFHLSYRPTSECRPD
jgi:hypothetical protein